MTYSIQATNQAKAKQPALSSPTKWKDPPNTTIRQKTGEKHKKAPQRAAPRNIIHYENTPIQIYWKFYHQKRKIFR